MVPLKPHEARLIPVRIAAGEGVCERVVPRRVTWVTNIAVSSIMGELS